MPKSISHAPLSVALRRVRLHLDMNQAELAKKISCSRRSIVRWERGDAQPMPADRAHIVRNLRDVPFAVLAPLARALGIAIEASPLGSEEAKRVLDSHLHAVAEGADVSARRLRAAVVAVLDKAIEMRTPIEMARALLAQPAR